MKEKLRVPTERRSEAITRIAAAIERAMRDLTDACPWPQRGACPLDLIDAGMLTGHALLKLKEGGASV